jgi:hypothetical protein
MRYLAPLFLVTLAGCATEPPVPLEVKVQQVSNVDLCRAVYYAPANVGMVARDEASRRGINCMDYMPVIVQQDQARAAADSAVTARPLPVIPPLTFQPAQTIQAPRPINCSSYRLGNTVQTNCN